MVIIASTGITLNSPTQVIAFEVDPRMVAELQKRVMGT